ncbi:MAG TPA: hypothetical protein ENH13_01045 [Euryarchaeota archaeon]|nr:hypothetical protein [Euryarchaeota archaeon]
MTRDWAEGIKGQDKTKIQKEATEFSQEYLQDSLHNGTPELLEHFTNNGFFTAIISASPTEALEATLAKFNINLIIGTNVETIDEIYTGNLNPAMDGKGKGSIIQTLFETHNLNPLHSFSFGDTEHDAPLLDYNDITGIALHPNTNLERLAREKGWPVHHDTEHLLQELKGKPRKTEAIAPITA